MADQKYPKSQLPIRRTVELLPAVFQSEYNDKFLSGTLDPLTQPGVLEKTVGYVGKRFGKTYKGGDIYLDTDETLRSRYQLEVGVTVKQDNKVENFYDYLDIKNQLRFFGNTAEQDNKITAQKHYTWDPPIDWDKFVNYREYYWEPLCPPSVPVLGQSVGINSTYTVKLGTGSTYIFTPDAFTNNPTVTLYRGQTYKFKVNAPYDGFIIRTNYDTGSLIYNPNLPYPPGALVVFDGKLWKSKVAIRPDGSTIDIDSQDWILVDDVAGTNALNYEDGITNNGVENGTLTFNVPYDAPDILFYQSKTDPNRFGKFIISDIEENTKINVELEIIGKENYTSSNGIVFTNGLVVEFRGMVFPTKYSQDTWVVEGVGSAITLTRVQDLVPTEIPNSAEDVVFDGAGFDTQPFDDATLIASLKDYILIARDSNDLNSWSRYNRWFHRSVLEYAYKLRGQDFPADENFRARRPIIEFRKNIQLYNHGNRNKTSVDFIDTFTTDVFSTIEGSIGYSVENEPLFDGARILVTADTDELANNRIYEVKFITHNNRRQIALVKTSDSEPLLYESVLIKRGTSPNDGGNRGLMYHYTTVINENGIRENKWVSSQRKTKVNQPPLFDVFDQDEISFSDLEKYPDSTFAGTKLFSYKQGSGPVDKELGFSISYLNIDNVGDINFDWNFEQEQVSYNIDRISYKKNISTGFYKFINPDTYSNGWIDFNQTYEQPIIDSVILETSTNKVTFDTIEWRNFDELRSILNLYRNGILIRDSFIREGGTFTFSKKYEENDVISIKIISDIDPDQGYYDIPLGLEKNPLNNNLLTFTLGQAVDHLTSSLEFERSLVGIIPGVSNLRDLTGYQNYGRRFLKHAVPVPLAVTLLCDKNINIIKSLQYAKKSYSEFKNSFLIHARDLSYDNFSIVDFVDKIIEVWSRSKTSASPFANSDMIGNGAYTSIKYKVDDEGILTFSLSEKFSLTELSKRAVYVYINGKQLLHGIDYDFDANFGFVRILTNLIEGDDVEIREYISTAFNYIPPTPTSMGLYKKYTPRIFVDDTYIEPKTVIQGHDGSLIDAFGDYRDDAILELEYRIYNNIKRNYDPQLFDIDQIVGGYYGNSIYNKQQLDEIINQEFLKWVKNTNINYIDNGFYDSQDAFTYTYSNMTDPTETKRLPGWWRGVYKWFYDTDRPHLTPWEMFGFSEKPDWWESQYGAAPYTKNNLLLWEDIRDGIIRQGSRAGVYDRYKRSSILSHIPVDENGELLDPLASNLARNFSLINNTGPFALGDVAPVENAWRITSEFPFAIVIAMCLLRPFDYIARNYDNSKIKFNKLNHLVAKDTDTFIKISDLALKQQTGLVTGLIQYVRAYVLSNELSENVIFDKLLNIDVNLSHRLSGFVDKEQQKYLLDSKSPKSASSSIFVPPENYDIIFNVGTVFLTISYSGVIVEKTDRGWVIKGYDDLKPYFDYHPAIANQKDPLLQVGGVSEEFKDWEPNVLYNNGQLVRYRSEFYRAIKTHESTENFDIQTWKKVPKVPLIGSVEAFVRKNFDARNPRKLFYGTVLLSIQDVVDFLLGYEDWLKSQGFVFDGYNKELGSAYNWTTSCREFMFWTRQNWALGSLIALSPISQTIKINYPVGVADNLLDGFYEYRVLRDDGQILRPEFIDVYRSFQTVKISTNEKTNDGIYFIRVNYVLKEHVTIFSDRTVFNDVLYDKTTGYRQERIKVQGYRTVDWDGDYTSPGFLFDNVSIQVWQPFTDYRLGDIVAYRSFNWTSLENQVGTEIFDDTKWTKLDSSPEKSLVANFDYRINQIEDYYEVASEGLGASQRMLARHSIGYQTRDYLQNLAEDQVTQFRLYQGFIKEKGTNNAIIKVFDKLSRSGEDSVSLSEEWAFRIGRLGGIDQYKEIEIELFKNNLKLNPQSVIVVPTIDENVVDQNYYVSEGNFTKLINTNFQVDINPVSLNAETVKTAGYVKLDNIEHVLKTRDDLLTYDLTILKENDHIWITFDQTSWTVLRFNEAPLLVIEDVSRTGDTVTIALSRRHQLQVGDIVGIEIENLTGFFTVTNNQVGSSLSSFEVVKVGGPDPSLDNNKFNNIKLLTEVRYADYDSLDEEEAALLKNNSRLWIDNNGEDLWEVISKKKQYNTKTIRDAGIASPSSLGTKVLYSDSLKLSFVSDPASGVVAVYSETSSNLNIKQIITPPPGLENSVKGSFGKKMALSPDDRFLVIAAPDASGIPSNYLGDLDKFLNIPPLGPKNIAANDLFLYRGRLWRSKESQVIILDDSTKIDAYAQDWEPAESINVNFAGRNQGYSEQGVIFVYELVNQVWELRDSIISPRPDDAERFGSEVTLAVNGSSYFMAVSAIGSLQNTGRVYLYDFVVNPRAIQSFFGSLCNYTTNTIDFPDPHSYFDGQKVTYFNGTPEGNNTSTQEQPPPPAPNTEFYVIRVDRFRIQLAASPADARDTIPINLRDIGIDDSSSHTIVSDQRVSAWRHFENQNYRGIYGEIPRSPTYNNSLYLQPAFYPQGSIVWSNNKLWQAQTDTFEDGSSLSVTSGDWLEVSDISTQSSLPFNLYLGNDHSTLDVGILDQNQLYELVKEGDQFGSSLAMSRDGNILAVGAPLSDGQFFVNYKGIWQADVEYLEGQVVKYFDENETNSWGYYRLVDNRIDITVDSTVRSIGSRPGDNFGNDDFIWDRIGDSTDQPVGKVYIYQKNDGGIYQLTQTITSSTLSEINDLVEDIAINVGDEFGHALDIDYSGSTLVISSPKSDKNFINQGSVYVFRTAGFAALEYRLKQKLESFEKYPNEYFGQDVCISSNSGKIVVGAKNSRAALPTIYNTYESYIDQRIEGAPYAQYVPASEELSLNITTFDEGKTTFFDMPGFSGAVYVFDLKDTKYFLTEKLDPNISLNESFGFSISCNSSIILVGSPKYIAPAPHEAVLSYDGPITGTARLFYKTENTNSWEILSTRKPLVDIENVKSISLIDAEKHIKIQDIDFIDPAKFKILNLAEQEIKFKVPYDPAVYNIGTDEQIVDNSISWAEKHVGEIWWDTSKAKWIYYEQDDVAYSIGNWSRLAEGSEILVCEWIESSLLPSEWAALADTNEGLAEGISGQPLYPNDDVYTIKELFNITTGELTETKYFYWVKNKVTLPQTESRKISAATISSLISNPLGSGTTFIAFVAPNVLSLYNFNSIISSDRFYLNIERYRSKINANETHNEYVLLTENVAASIPPEKIENKWIDSLVGWDVAGNRVPDPTLKDNRKYGIEYRPRQSLFVNRLEALKITVRKINSILEIEPFSDLIDFTTLNSKDDAPSELLREYDQIVDTYADLELVGVSRVRPALFQAIIENGQITGITIVDEGFGYKSKELVTNTTNRYLGPEIEIEGDGTGAKAVAIINEKGSVIDIDLKARGKKYSVANPKIRNFSVLVVNDETRSNFWSVYAWDNLRKFWLRTRSQAFDTTRYWEFIDWWKDGYSNIDRIIVEIENIFVEPSINVKIGDLIRIKEYGNGGWAVFEKISNEAELFSEKYILVGRYRGTIRILESIYEPTIEGIGYDNTKSFDEADYDIDNSKEIRNILKSVKEDIFVNIYNVEWNRLFFASIKYVFSEQLYVDWAFKTSFLKAIHSVGDLEEKFNYRNDNLESFQNYIEEVKPYRTTVREYVSNYKDLGTYSASVSDFDLPSVYSKTENRIVTIGKNSGFLNQYPWKYWSDNRGFSVIGIQVYDQGSEYNSPPKVLIEGDGIEASARAFISNGAVSDIEVINQGRQFTVAPTVTLVGGTSGRRAKAVAIIGDSKVRTFSLTVKFDRIAKIATTNNFNFEDIFIASGNTGVFELNYAPSRNKSKIKVFVDQQIVLPDEYTIEFYKSTVDSYNLLRAKIIFASAPTVGARINIQYEKNIELLDATSRIEQYYSPSAGMKDKSFGQLMTGIDFGGVQIQGTTFDVTGGWDALPWFTDNWDSVEASSDFYVVCDGSTAEIKLPYIPAEGQEINIYLKRSGSIGQGSYSTNEETGEVIFTPASEAPVTVRIDDPNYTNAWDSSNAVNPNAQMPTFIGNGITDTITIAPFIEVRSGDVLIFRPVESDGSVTITDPNLLDTRLSGGTLENTGSGIRVANNTINGIYTTARGISAEEIILDGEKFISPDHVPAPEENVPGQVLEGLSIRVFHSTLSGVAPLQTRILYANGVSRVFDIKSTITNSKNILVYVDKILCSTTDTDSTLLYSIDFRLNQIEFTNPPPVNSVIEIITIGIGGVNLLDYKEYISDGNTNQFITGADYSSTYAVYVTVNGQINQVGFSNSSDIPNAVKNKTVIDFGLKPERLSKIKIVCIGQSDVTDSTAIPVVEVNSEVFEFDNSSRSFEIQRFTNVIRDSVMSSVLVELNGEYLRGVDTNQYIIDDSFLTTVTTILGTRNVYELSVGTDPFKSPGSILASNVKVYKNNQRLNFIADYVYDGVDKKIIFEEETLQTGDIVRIENDLEAEYLIENEFITIQPSVTLQAGDLIEVTWFNEYPSMKMTSDEYVGGKIVYKLTQTPLAADYVWVYKNGVRLTQDVDYIVTLPRSTVSLRSTSDTNDLIKIVVFGSPTLKLPSAFEISKDMLNIYQFKRWSITDTELAAPLNYYDQTISVNDASKLADPNVSRNVPGTIFINGERIEYFKKEGNILSQLRRGVNGTSIGILYSLGSKIVDVSVNETLPYNENQYRSDFISDGSTLLVGLLDYSPSQANKSRWYSNNLYNQRGEFSLDTAYSPKDVVQKTTIIDLVIKREYFVAVRLSQGNPITDSYYWDQITIPEDFGPCDEIEVFVSGRRLRKDPMVVYDQDISSSSAEGNRILEAEFAVDITSAGSRFIRLTTAPAAGSRISIIKKTGNIWKERASGNNVIQSALSLLENNTPVAKFIAQKTTKLPE